MVSQTLQNPMGGDLPIEAFIGHHVDEVANHPRVKLNYVVVDREDIITNIFIAREFPNWCDLITGDYHNLNDFHSIRHFDKTGDCDFRYYIPIDLLD